MDDYAHHPTEVEATLEAAAKGWPGRRIVAVFQPHLFSRTRDLQEEFARAFYDADVLVLTDVFPAREKPIHGITGELIATLARQYGHRDVHYVENKADLPLSLKMLTRPGDLVVTMGAGDVWRYGQAFLDALAPEAGEGMGEEGRGKGQESTSSATPEASGATGGEPGTQSRQAGEAHSGLGTQHASGAETDG